VKNRNATCVRVLEHEAAVVKIVRGDDAPYRLTWAGSVTVDGGRSAGLQRALAGATGPVTQLVPGGDIDYGILPLPRLKPGQQDLAMRGLVAREQDGSAGDWLVDFAPVASGTVQRQDFGTAFARDSVMRRHLVRAQALDIRPDLQTAGYLALDALYRAHRPDPEAEGAWNLVCLDARASFLCVGDADGLLFQRELPADLSEGAELAEYLERLTTEVERSNFFAQQAERSLRVARVVVCGDPSLADALVVRLDESLAVDAERWRPEELFAGAGDTVRPDLVLAMAGAAAALDGWRPNLLPAEFRRNRAREMRRGARKVSTVGAVIAVPLLLIGGLLTVNVQRESLAALEAREDLLRQRAEETAREYLRHRALHTRQDHLDAYRPDRIDVAALLTDIARRTPDAVVYRHLSIAHDQDGGYRLQVSGESLGQDGQRAQEVFLEFQEAMRRCERLRELDERSHLQLTAADEDQDASSRVIFVLEYRITEEPGGEDQT
jgi:Tfp pilus assembly protein PilN